MSVVGELSVRIIGDTKDLEKDLDRAYTKVSKWSKRVGIAAAGATAAMVKYGLSTGDALAKTADKLGIQTEKLQALQFAAEQTGVSANTMNMAMQRMVRRVAEASKGTGEAVGALQEMGISAQNLARMSPDQQMNILADAMQNVSNQGDRVRLSMKLFDSEGVALVNTLKGGSEQLKVYADEAAALGLALNRADAAKLEMANDAIAKLGESFKGTAQKLAVQFAPVLKGISDFILDMAKDTGGFKNELETLFTIAVKGAGFAADAFRGWQVIIKGLEGAFFGLKASAIWVSQKIVEGISNALNTIKENLNVLIEGMNNLPGVDISKLIVGESQAAGILKDMHADAVNEILQVNTELQEILNRPMPSEGLENWVATVQTKMDEAVQSYRTLNTTMIEEDKLTKEQLITQQREYANAMIQEAINQEERQSQIRKDYANSRIREAIAQDQIAKAGKEQFFSDLEGIAQSSDRKMKKLSVIMAVRKGWEAAVKAWDAGMATGGPWAPAVAASYTAASLAKTGKMVSKINSGGSSAGGGGGGGVASAATAKTQQEPGRMVNVNFQGGDYERLIAGNLLGMIDDELKRGGRVDGLVMT